MIELTRALARSFRAVLRHSLAEQTPRHGWPPVLCPAGDGGLTLQAVQTETALRRHQTGPRPTDRIAFRADVLARFEGRTEAPVALENVAAGKGRARWEDGGVPCALDFDTVPPDGLPPLPDPPAKWTPMPAEFLLALDEASHSAARESARFALTCIQLRGQRGEVVGTDGGQLLVQAGFPFPWAEDLLVPRLSAFGRRELTGHAEVRIGRARNHVAVAAGPWTLLLAVDATGRYPDAQAVIPRLPPDPSRLVLDEEDAVFLASALPKLPGGGDFNAPITLDLGRPPAVRAPRRRVRPGRGNAAGALQRFRPGGATLHVPPPAAPHVGPRLPRAVGGVAGRPTALPRRPPHLPVDAPGQEGGDPARRGRVPHRARRVAGFHPLRPTP